MKITKYLQLALLAAALTGCASANRLSITPAERNYHAMVKHTEPKADAFNHVELALAEAPWDLPRVLKLRQPESGTFLLKPLVTYRVAGVLQYAECTLKILVVSDTISLDFQLGPELTYGAWPPANEIPKIKAEFRGVAERVAKAVGGKVEG